METRRPWQIIFWLLSLLSPGIVSSHLSLAKVNDMVTPNHKGQRGEGRW